MAEPVAFVDIGDVLEHGLFMPGVRETAREPLLVTMVAALCAAFPVLPYKDVLTSVLEREKVRSTGTSDGVAFPHGKYAGAAGVYAVLATAPQGIDFGAGEYMPCQIVVLTVSSAYRADGHLHFLSYMARCLRDPHVRAMLLKARNGDAFAEALQHSCHERHP